MNKRKITLSTFAVPLSGNKGSASMLLGLRDALKVGNIDVTWKVFSYYPNRDQRIADEMPDVTVHPGHPKHIFFQLLPALILWRIGLGGLLSKSWKEHIQALVDSDGVLLMGGTTFADSMLFKVPWNVLAALPGYFLKKPSFFLSQTMGPLKRTTNRLAAKWTLRRAVCIHGRGVDSRDCLHGIGLEQATYEPDLSFPMEIPSFDEVCSKYDCVQKLRPCFEDPAVKLVAITPNSIVHEKLQKMGKDYIDQLVSIILYVKQAGCMPVLIPHSYREDVSRLHNNDRALCQAVVEKLPPESCLYLDADLPSPELRTLIGEVHLLVASRFHSMVSALSTGVPPITFGWGNHKYSEVLKEFEMEHLYVPFHEMTTERFAELFDVTLKDRDQLAQTISKASEQVKEQASGIASIILSRF